MEALAHEFVMCRCENEEMRWVVIAWSSGLCGLEAAILCIVLVSFFVFGFVFCFLFFCVVSLVTDRSLTGFTRSVSLAITHL